MNILALSGSLRKNSHNTALLKTMQSVALKGVEIILFNGLVNIPPFNPDVDPSNEPKVMVLKQLLARSNGLFIASPEYAHGISGVLKNALDWLV